MTNAQNLRNALLSLVGKVNAGEPSVSPFFSPSCLAMLRWEELARSRTSIGVWNFTTAEKEHIHSCDVCTRLKQMFEQDPQQSLGSSDGDLPATFEGESDDSLTHRQRTLSQSPVREDNFRTPFNPSEQPPGVGRLMTDRRRRHLEQRLLKAFEKFVRRSQRTMLVTAQDMLSKRLAAFTDRISAGCAWLFAPNAKCDHLISCAEYNVPPGQPVPRKGQSIVWHVYQTGQPHYAPAIEKEPRYNPVVSGIRSALSVPLCKEGLDGGPPLGVLHFESFSENAFPAAVRGDALAFARSLVPLFTVFRNGCFNPYHSGWSPDHQFEQALIELKSAWAGEDGVAPSLALWYIDRAKAQYWTVAATGYGGEFCRGSSLSSNSFFARKVANQPAGMVVPARPEEFVHHWDKAARMGVEKVTYIVLPPCEEGRDTLPRWVLAVYYSATALTDVPSNSFFRRLAKKWQRWHEGIAEDLLRLADSHIRCGIDIKPRHFDNPSIPLIEAVRGILDADQATALLSVSTASGVRRLVPVGSTGKIRDGNASNATHEGGVVQESTRAYSVDEDKSTSFSAWQVANGVPVVRKHNVFDSNETGLLPGFPSEPSRKIREVEHENGYDRARYLSVLLASGSEVLGIIRWVRREAGRPFREWDEVLGQRLSAAASGVLQELRWKKMMSEAGVTPRTQSLPSGPLVFAPSQSARQILRTLVWEFQAIKRNVEVYFHEAGEADGELATLYDRYPIGEDIERTPDAVGRLLSPEVRRLVDGGQPVTWRACGHASASYACVPVLAWNGFTPIRGYLSVVEPKGGDWTPENLKEFLVHSHRLGEVFVRQTFSGGQTRLNGFEEFATRACEVLDADGVRIRLSGPDSRVVRVGDIASGDAVWEPIDNATSPAFDVPDGPRALQLAGRYGARLTTDARFVQFPLRIGSLRVGDLDWGLIRSTDWDHLIDRIEDLSELWWQFITMHGWEVDFGDPHSVGALDVWSPVVRWTDSTRLATSSANQESE